MFNVYSNFQILIEYLALSLQGYIKQTAYYITAIWPTFTKHMRNKLFFQSNLTIISIFFLLLQVQYKKDYEKTKAKSDYNTLPATENPLLRQLRYAGTILSDVRLHTFFKMQR